MTKLIKAIEKWPGWRVENAAKGFRVYPPDKSKAPITIHKTPSDNRWKKNLVSELRRAGAPL